MIKGSCPAGIEFEVAICSQSEERVLTLEQTKSYESYLKFMHSVISMTTVRLFIP